MKIEELYQYFLQSSGICTDTRKISTDCLFFSLKGENFDANEFAQQALNQGAAFAVIDNKKYFTDEEKMVLVPDCLTALQELAHYHRKELGLPIIALTGSNGKTTTKELIHVVLSKKYNTKATIGNLNNHIGVPLTLLSFNEDTDIGIVEMGANHQKEIEKLCKIVEPDFGYVTNFGKAHLEGFGGVEGVIKGKSELYQYLKDFQKTAFVNLNDSIQKEKTEQLSRYTFAINSEADVKIDAVSANPMVRIEFKKQTINSNLIGIYNANNINAAITIGTYFNVPENDIKNAIETYTPTNNRSQITIKNGNQIILDAYNANPSSMSAAIQNFIQLDGNHKIAILGDMFELGKESLSEHKKIVDLLINTNQIDTYFIGKDFYENKINSKHLHFFETFETFTAAFQDAKPKESGCIILVKGSRGMALERTLAIL
jgi:UDP-N-acetylmuramoyl-tripeptide--D-alanyl-D-alanine ligase